MVKSVLNCCCLCCVGERVGGVEGRRVDKEIGACGMNGVLSRAEWSGCA